VVRATDRGRTLLEEGRDRRIGDLAGLLEGLAPPELETLAAATSIVEGVLRRSPSA
jgi:hypothetical protein